MQSSLRRIFVKPAHSSHLSFKKKVFMTLSTDITILGLLWFFIIFSQFQTTSTTKQARLEVQVGRIEYGYQRHLLLPCTNSTALNSFAFCFHKSLYSIYKAEQMKILVVLLILQLTTEFTLWRSETEALVPSSQGKHSTAFPQAFSEKTTVQPKPDHTRCVYSPS